MKHETFTSLAQYTCAECGELNNAACWAVSPVCDDFSVFYDCCACCNSLTVFVERDGCIMSLGTYQRATTDVLEMMRVAGAVQRWVHPVGHRWNVEKQAFEEGFRNDEVPF